tara:strand:- start:930 stop:1490 length:561 start_codon:yes stop_codon:yes gene_type:complete
MEPEKVAKVSKKSKSKIKFYLEHGSNHKFHDIKVTDLESAKRKFSVTNISKFISDEEGYSSEAVFFNFESQGKYFPCRLDELDKLFDMFNGKKQIDILIDNISTDIVDNIFVYLDMVNYKEYPTWFKTAFINFAKKKGANEVVITNFETLRDKSDLTETDCLNVMRTTGELTMDDYIQTIEKSEEK